MIARHRAFALSIVFALTSGCAPGQAERGTAQPSDAGRDVVSDPREVAPSRWGASNPDWIERVEPFRVIGNVYYVGTRGLSAWLIAGDEGHILLDVGLPENAPIVLENIRALGFDPADVKTLLNSHAHFDHSGGLAAVKRVTGARLLSMEGDRSALEGGFYLGSEDDPDMSAPPVAVDVTIVDGETVRLGRLALTAHLTPGHTRGCTSWSMSVEEAGAAFEALFFCSATVAANRLADKERGSQYEGIVDDYRRTFERARSWRPDVFLSNHPGVFEMDAKRARQKAGEALAFVDREGFPKMMARLEADFERRLAEQRAAAGQ